MSGSDGIFRPSSHDPLPSHPAGLAIARGSSAPRGPRGRPCVRTLGPRSERWIRGEPFRTKSLRLITAFIDNDSVRECTKAAPERAQRPGPSAQKSYFYTNLTLGPIRSEYPNTSCHQTVKLRMRPVRVVS